MNVLRHIWKWTGGVLIAIDQLGNALLYGYPDETISSRAGKWLIKNKDVEEGVWYWLCRALNVIDKNHCIDAIEWDEGEQLKLKRRYQDEGD